MGTAQDSQIKEDDQTDVDAEVSQHRPIQWAAARVHLGEQCLSRGLWRPGQAVEIVLKATGNHGRFGTTE